MDSPIRDTFAQLSLESLEEFSGSATAWLLERT
jgi:hypothetical protein